MVVTELRSDDGLVGLRLFDQAKGFPSDREKAIREIFIEPTQRQADFELSQLPFGLYAVGSIHDENGNHDFDKNFLGIPREGFGASNNAKIRFGPPSYGKSTFSFSEDGQRITIEMNYF